MSNKKKTIKLQIKKKDFPLLFKLRDDKFDEMCMKLLCRGYESYFPDIKNIKSNMDGYQTDSIKLDIKNLQNTLDKMDMSENICKFSSILEQLFGISHNSSKKGKISENMIYAILRQKFKDYTIEETRNRAHYGDGIINIPTNDKDKDIRVMIEIKNYSKAVDSNEIKKLRRDMKYTNIKYSLFISLKSGFVGKKQMAIEEFKSNGKMCYIIYIPNMMDDICKIESAMALIHSLIEFNKHRNNKNIEIKWLEHNISDHLKQLDTVYNDYSQLKDEYNKMEKNIKQSMDTFYIRMRSYENNIKKKINDIWKSIHREFSRAEDELIVGEEMDTLIELYKKKKSKINRRLILIFEIFKKNGYLLSMINTKNKYMDIWYINKGNKAKPLTYERSDRVKDTKTVGSIIKNRKNIKIIFNNSPITFDIGEDHDIKISIDMLDKYLRK